MLEQAPLPEQSASPEAPPLASAQLPALHAWHSQVTVITGTIGSGKSTVVRALAERGIFTRSSDELSRELDRDPQYRAELRSLFGAEIFASDGSLERPKLSALVFADPDKKARLEAVARPRLLELTEQHFSAAIKQGISPLILEAGNFFEAGLDTLGFKRIILISAEDEHCLERLVKGRGLSTEQARKRIAAQLPRTEKEARSDIVFSNFGSEADLHSRIEGLIALIRA